MKKFMSEEMKKLEMGVVKNVTPFEEQMRIHATLAARWDACVAVLEKEREIHANNVPILRREGDEVGAAFAGEQVVALSMGVRVLEGMAAAYHKNVKQFAEAAAELAVAKQGLLEDVRVDQPEHFE